LQRELGTLRCAIERRNWHQTHPHVAYESANDLLGVTVGGNGWLGLAGDYASCSVGLTRSRRLRRQPLFGSDDP
jgi:hypothetical protein